MKPIKKFLLFVLAIPVAILFSLLLLFLTLYFFFTKTMLFFDPYFVEKDACLDRGGAWQEDVHDCTFGEPSE